MLVFIFKGKFYFKMVHKIALNSQLRFQNFKISPNLKGHIRLRLPCTDRPTNKEWFEKEKWCKNRFYSLHVATYICNLVPLHF